VLLHNPSQINAAAAAPTAIMVDVFIDKLSLGACFFRGVKVHAGITIFDYTGNPRLGLSPKPGAVNRAKEFITKGLVAGKLTPKIDRVFNGLEEYQLAHHYMATNGRNGKIIISLH
jgi:NADPH:quinone reductase-like Zn-dependent oxidoreductase